MGEKDSPKTPPRSLMDDLLGLLRIRVKRGVNLAVRDVNSSDPYVVVKMGKQVLPTSSSSLHYGRLHYLKTYLFPVCLMIDYTLID